MTPATLSISGKTCLVPTFSQHCELSQPTPPTPPTLTAGSVDGGSCTYRALPGDTLQNIATAYGISLAQIIDMNRQIIDPNVTHANQKIYVPCGSKPSNGGSIEAGTKATTGRRLMRECVLMSA